MRILAIDPAQKTGLAWYDTDKRAMRSASVVVKNPFDISQALLSTRNFCAGERPDRVIVEHPFLQERKAGAKSKQSIQGYNTHLTRVFYWQCAIWDLWGLKGCHEKKGTFRHGTKFRLVYPRTWQGPMFEGMKVRDSKIRARITAQQYCTQQGLEVPASDLPSDEHDAICLAAYCYNLSRTIKTGNPTRDRLFKKMQEHGAIIVTPEERGLLI